VTYVDPQEFGKLVGIVEAIHENTRDLPELKKMVERHDVQLRGMLWGIGTIATSIIGAIMLWVKAQFHAR
jgi:hypothetical protein